MEEIHGSGFVFTGIDSPVQQCLPPLLREPAGDDRKGISRELTADEISRIADGCVEMGVLWCLLGGVSALRADFEEIYMMLSAQGSSGVRLYQRRAYRPPACSAFKERLPSDRGERVWRSQKTYEQITRKAGSYKAFRHGLDLLMENGVPVRLKAMALQSNFHEFGQIADFCRAHTKDYYRFRSVSEFAHRQGQVKEQRDCGRTPDSGANRFAGRNDTARFFQLEKCAKTSPGEPSPARLRPSVLMWNRASDFFISYDGLFRLCVCLTAPGTTYDLRRGSLQEAWRFLPGKVKSLRSKNEKYLTACKNADDHLCASCPAMAFLESGDLEQPVSYFCDIANARAKALYGGEVPAGFSTPLFES